MGCQGLAQLHGRLRSNTGGRSRHLQTVSGGEFRSNSKYSSRFTTMTQNEMVVDIDPHISPDLHYLSVFRSSILRVVASLHKIFLLRQYFGV